MNLSTEVVAAALPRVRRGLGQYRSLQARLYATDCRTDRAFQRDFNRYYRIRRGPSWQGVFYDLMEREKTERRGFEAVLRDVHAQLGLFEASFASKLVASVDPSLPVIDQFVLKNFELSLPARTAPSRIEGIVVVHQQLAGAYARILASPEGRAAVAQFDAAYPDSADLHGLKKLDLLLWQTR